MRRAHESDQEAIARLYRENQNLRHENKRLWDALEEIIKHGERLLRAGRSSPATEECTSIAEDALDRLKILTEGDADVARMEHDDRGDN